MDIINEEFQNDSWIICDEKELRSRPNFEKIVWRTIWKFNYEQFDTAVADAWKSIGSSTRDTTIYKLGKEWHRLDGPAVVKTNQLGCDLWYVNNIYLESFISCLPVIGWVFKYIEDHPQFVNEVLMLAEFNQWPLPMEKIQPILDDAKTNKKKKK